MLEPLNRRDAARPGVTLEADHGLPFHYESRRDIATAPETLFSCLDDHNRLSGHMSQSSWMMAGSRMEIVLDADKGQAVGSHIHLKGRVLGVPLDVEEVVTVYHPPAAKSLGNDRFAQAAGDRSVPDGF